MQCGGWTIDWQGKSGQPIPGGTSILDAIKARAGGGVTVATGGQGAAGDVAVVVVGEMPYAEAIGDRADLSLAPADVAAVKRAKAGGATVVVVVLCGRPLILGEVLDEADAVVVAWLPGSEGAGVADVLFGDHKPTGKLAFAWPRSMDQVPAGAGGEALFPLGFGLSYGD